MVEDLRTASLPATVTKRHYTQQAGCSLPMCLGPRASRLGQGAMITGCVRAVSCVLRGEGDCEVPTCAAASERALIWWTDCCEGRSRHTDSERRKQLSSVSQSLALPHS